MYRKVHNIDTGSLACRACGSKRLRYSGQTITCTNCGHVVYSAKTKRNKMNATKTVYDDKRYDSKFEANCAAQIDLMVRGGAITKVERQVKIPLEAYGKVIFNYYIDFVVTYPDGHIGYWEAKGYETALWKAKWKMLEAKLAVEDPGAEMVLWKEKSFKKVR